MDSKYICLLILVGLSSALRSEGFGTFGFDIHHRYSDSVKDFLNLDGLPEKGSLDYYAAMAHRDQLIKARRLAVTPASPTPLSFIGGNETYRLSSLGLYVFPFILLLVSGLFNSWMIILVMLFFSSV